MEIVLYVYDDKSPAREIFFAFEKKRRKGVIDE